MTSTSRLITIPVFLVLFFGLSVVRAQSQSVQIPLQHIQFTDKLVEGFLAIFWRRTDARFISVLIHIDPKDNGYIYQVDPIRHAEIVESFTSSKWGQWRGKTMLFFGWSDANTFCRITDTTALANLKRFATGLPRAMVRLKGNNGVRLGAFHEGPSLTFKLLNGREVYYYDSNGYDSREVPDSLPPVPESQRKQ